MGQVAKIEDGSSNLTSIANYNGVSSVGLQIIKSQDGNTVAVAKNIYEAVASLQSQLGTDATLSIVQDSSTSIKELVSTVEHMLIEGAILTTIIVFLFLKSWRSTVITGLSLPISVIGTFAFIYFLGFSLNSMTLLALAISIGILIDDAIVVRENIMRHLYMGKSHLRASLDGTGEIGFAVLATTLSIIAVFLPVAFMGGIIGRFFLQFGITIVVAVSISLLVTFTLDPMLSSVWKDPSTDKDYRHKYLGRISVYFNQLFDWFTERYSLLIKWSLHNRFKTISIAVISFAISIALIPKIGMEMVPTGSPSSFSVGVSTPDGSSLEYTEMKAKQVEDIIKSYPDVKSIYTSIKPQGSSNSSNVASI